MRRYPVGGEVDDGTHGAEPSNTRASWSGVLVAGVGERGADPDPVYPLTRILFKRIVAVMRQEIELAYVGVEVPDPASLSSFFGDVIGLVPGEPARDGADTWRNDGAAIGSSSTQRRQRRRLRRVRARDDDAFDTVTARLCAAGRGVGRHGRRPRRS
jgi:hypothetical protein